MARGEFAYGPGGARYYKKSTWTVEGTAPDPDTYPTEHTFYVGGFKEVIGAADSVQTTQVTDNVLHVRTTPDGGTATTSYEYLHRDHLGSVESVTDAVGAELWVMAYDPFGERRASDWTGELDDDGTRGDQQIVRVQGRDPLGNGACERVQQHAPGVQFDQPVGKTSGHGQGAASAQDMDGICTRHELHRLGERLRVDVCLKVLDGKHRGVGHRVQRLGRIVSGRLLDSVLADPGAIAERALAFDEASLEKLLQVRIPREPEHLREAHQRGGLHPGFDRHLGHGLKGKPVRFAQRVFRDSLQVGTERFEVLKQRFTKRAEVPWSFMRILGYSKILAANSTITMSVDAGF